MTTNARWLIAVLLLLPGMEVFGDEPANPSAPQAPDSPGVFGRIRDRWVKRTQALTPPSNPATQPEAPTAPIRDIAPNLSPLPAGSTRAGQDRPASPPAPAAGNVPPVQPPGSPPSSRATPASPSPSTPPTAAPTIPPAAPTIPPAAPTIPPATPGTSAATGTGIASALSLQPEAEAPTAALPGQGQILTSPSEVASFEPMTLLGDMSPLTTFTRIRATPLQTPPQPFPPHHLPRPPSPRAVSSLAPTTRSFEIADNQSPMPQDRVYFTFYYFNNLNAALNKKFESPVDELRAYRYIFGFEKTFDEGRGSIGIQLPLDNLTAESTVQGHFAKPGGSSTALDNLTVFSKYILKYNPETGSLISAGLAVTPRDGPDTFAGAKYLVGVNDTTVQPFIGYLWRRDRFYLHGFVALDVPTSIRDVTMVYNDIGIGYYVYRDFSRRAWLNALVPTFEVHINDPLTHGDFNNQFDPTGTPDVVNLTYGINAVVNQNAVFTFGVVTPVTGPRPFSYEIVALINWRFGRTRAPRAPLPMLGG